MTEFNVAFRMHRDLFVVVEIDNHFGTLTSHPIRQTREPRLARDLFASTWRLVENNYFLTVD